jgi:glycerol-3-phosphate dehydrogenase (NAD(P)+)
VSAFQRVVVAGAGAFGTALAVVAQRAGRDVTLFARDAEQAREIAARRENSRYLRGVMLPPSIAIAADPKALHFADLVLLAAPAQATRSLANVLAAEIPKAIPVIATAKGIEQQSGKFQSDIISDIVPNVIPAVLSGPGFADEIARGLPTAVTIAATDLALAHSLSAALATDVFRPYASDDLIGVELGGAIKNVLAIAAGIVAGRSLGESARAALIARGLAEMMRLGGVLGARSETFMGLSGLGDLVLTATSRHSRNLAFGMALGEGRNAAELLTAGMPLAEGAHTAVVATEVARRHRVDMPITEAVAAIIAGRLDVDAAIESLVSRPLKAESA